jgi:hypothetical protein
VSEHLKRHYEAIWGAARANHRLERGPVHQLPRDFHVLEFAPPSADFARVYATCGMSTPQDPERLELHLLTRSAEPAHVELLTVSAHFHRTGAALGSGHTVNFGRPIEPGSHLDHGLISLPYLYGPKLEWLEAPQGPVRCLWLIPITRAERDFKSKQGLEELERRFEEASFAYADPQRSSVVS